MSVIIRGDFGDVWQFWQFWQSPVALCLCPSARNPTPLTLLLKTKAKVQFERPVKRLSTTFFSRFSGRQFISISALFSRFYCSVGRGLQAFPITVWYSALASGQQLGASSFFFQRTRPFACKERASLYRILFAIVKCFLAWIGGRFEH